MRGRVVKSMHLYNGCAACLSKVRVFYNKRVAGLSKVCKFHVGAQLGCKSMHFVCGCAEGLSNVCIFRVGALQGCQSMHFYDECAAGLSKVCVCSECAAALSKTCVFKVGVQLESQKYAILRYVRSWIIKNMYFYGACAAGWSKV